MAAEAEVAPRSIAAAGVVLKAGQLMAGRWMGEEGEVASERRRPGVGLAKRRAGLASRQVGEQSRECSLEEGRYEGERILAQQG